MIFPKAIAKNDVIGVTALSDGADKELDQIRFDNGVKQLAKKNYHVKFTNNVFKADSKGRSSDGRIRADEFHQLIKDDEVSMIISAKGGNFLVEMLEYLDCSLIGAKPKWIQGYSDNTAILFPITTKPSVKPTSPSLPETIS